MNEHDFFKRFVYDPENDLLGSGGFGTVYRAYDHLEKRFVAIKISQVKDIHGKFTLLNEVELSKNIDDHTNVARYELGLRVKMPFPVDYAVMTYYEDGNLEMVLRKQKGGFNDQEQSDILLGLLAGIAHLHAENIIHRDLKLANILMHRTKQGQWRPKIADFGLSRQLDYYDSSFDNSAIGITIAYAAPEQIENKSIRRNVDLWAFGVIAYRILTGEMPFDAILGSGSTSASVEISRKIIQCELPDKLNSIPEPYQTMIRRCWVKDITLRVQSANELLALFPKNYPSPVLPFRPVQEAETRFWADSGAFKKDGIVQKQEAVDRGAFKKDRIVPMQEAETMFLANSEPLKQDLQKQAVPAVENTIGYQKKSKLPIYIGVGIIAVLVLGLYWGFGKQEPSKQVADTPKIEVVDKAMAAFQNAVKTHTLISYKKFLQSFPNSKYTAAATDSLTHLEKKYKDFVNDATIFILDKDFSSAKAYLNNALKINPNDAEIIKKLNSIQ